MFSKKKTASAAASSPSITAATQTKPTVNGTGYMDQAKRIVNRPAVVQLDRLDEFESASAMTNFDLSKQQIVTDGVSDVTGALSQHTVWGRQSAGYQAAYTRIVLTGYVKGKLDKGQNLHQVEDKLFKLETALKKKSATEKYPPCLPDMIARVRFENGLAPSLVYVS